MSLALRIFTFSLITIASGANISFPVGFEFGVSTSAYQIEGAWNEDGKGPSIWDNFTHRIPSPVKNNETGDIACDSYHRYKEDVKLAAGLGSNFYRFSIAWSRILPTGYADDVNKKGIEFYKNLIDEVIAYNMKPVVTMYHWDLPQQLYEDGVDWTSSDIIPVFVNYARVLIKHFPEVSRWLTINEPRLICHWSYGLGTLAPGVKGDGTLEYKCAYNVLQAHAAVYRMYKKEFPHHKAKMSIVIDAQWIEPFSTSEEDIEAAERQKEFEFGLYFHPLLKGGWPKVFENRIKERSRGQNITSRLPHFTKRDIKAIKGSFDFISVNHFHTRLAANDKEAPSDVISYASDLRVVNSLDPSWPVQANGWGTVPASARKVLNWIKSLGGDHEILITELSVAENTTSLSDSFRIETYQAYICNILAANKQDNINVTGMAAWALIDNFGWRNGFDDHMGLYYIDFKNPELIRVPKASAQFWKDMSVNREIDCDKWVKVNELL